MKDMPRTITAMLGGAGLLLASISPALAYGGDDLLAPLLLSRALGGLSSERWPANYVPDDYVLEDYNGRDDDPSAGQRICEQGRGRTLSTSPMDCGEREPGERAGRTLSTH